LLKQLLNRQRQRRIIITVRVIAMSQDQFESIGQTATRRNSQIDISTILKQPTGALPLSSYKAGAVMSELTDEEREHVRRILTSWAVNPTVSYDSKLTFPDPAYQGQLIADGVTDIIENPDRDMYTTDVMRTAMIAVVGCQHEHTERVLLERLLCCGLSRKARLLWATRGDQAVLDWSVVYNAQGRKPVTILTCLGLRQQERAAQRGDE
jgi:hypothetical protein